jgi:hypothetical protein
MDLLKHIFFRLSLLPFSTTRLLLRVVVATTRLLCRTVWWIVHNSFVRKFTNHLSRLPFRVITAVTSLLHQSIRKAVRSSNTALIFLLKALINLLKTRFVARATRYAIYSAALVIAYSVITTHLETKEHGRQQRLARDEAKKEQERYKRLKEEHMRQKQNTQEERQRARDHWKYESSSRPQYSHKSPRSQCNQRPNTLGHDFQTWRNKCKSLSNDKASVTALPQPPGDIAALYRNARLLTDELEKERLIWHPDTWSRVPEPHRANVIGVVTEISQIVNAMYDDREKQ